ncbi:MAG: ABC transporter substrate-binding protein [Burkholderiales bacterium]|nr:ABC transporter substrate-binding protein [Burkholderiales bacterium]
MTSPRRKLATLAAATVATLLATTTALPARAQGQGVSKDTVLIGTIQDLSGPVAALGKQVRLGMQLRIDEFNEQGGAHGRKLKLQSEDSGYDPKKAVLAAQKLVNQDKVFAVVGHIGTAQNVATFPVLFPKNVLNFFPTSAAREMYEPHHRLKYAFSATYYDAMRVGVPRVAKEKSIKKACILHQDDEFGLEVLRGTEDGLKTLGLALAEKTSYKRGATDFSSQVQKLAAAQCEMVVMGTVLRETIGTMATARKSGFNPVFFASGAAYSDLVHKLGGPAVEGLITAHTVQHPYIDDEQAPLRFWANKYKTKFNEEPSVFSVYGYNAVDAFIRAVTKAGPNLTTDSFIKAMDTISIPPDIFGAPELSFTASKRLGNDRSRLSQIQNGRWKVISDYMKN